MLLLSLFCFSQSLTFKRKGKRLGKSNFEHMAMSACFISQDKLGKAGKLFVFQKLQANCKKKRQCLLSLASCLPTEGCVLPQRNNPSVERKTTGIYIHMCIEGKVLRSVLETAGPKSKPPPRALLWPPGQPFPTMLCVGTKFCLQRVNSRLLQSLILWGSPKGWMPQKKRGDLFLTLHGKAFNKLLKRFFLFLDLKC